MPCLNIDLYSIDNNYFRILLGCTDPSPQSIISRSASQSGHVGLWLRICIMLQWRSYLTLQQRKHIQRQGKDKTNNRCPAAFRLRLLKYMYAAGEGGDEAA